MLRVVKGGSDDDDDDEDAADDDRGCCLNRWKAASDTTNISLPFVLILNTGWMASIDMGVAEEAAAAGG